MSIVILMANMKSLFANVVSLAVEAVINSCSSKLLCWMLQNKTKITFLHDQYRLKFTWHCEGCVLSYLTTNSVLDCVYLLSLHPNGLVWYCPGAVRDKSPGI